MDDEINYLLNETNQYFDTKIEKSDILSSWKGLRPLIKNVQNNATSNIVREHHIYQSKSNLITIAGGKWTTYRKMAEDVLNYVVEHKMLTFKKRCETKSYKVVGSKNIMNKITDEVSSQTFMMMVGLYGDKTFELLKIAKEEDGYEKINKNFLYIKAQIIYAVRNEYVQKPLDFMCRRIPLLLLNKKEALSSLIYVTSILATLFDWDEKKYIEELNSARDCIEQKRF